MKKSATPARLLTTLTLALTLLATALLTSDAFSRRVAASAERPSKADGPSGSPRVAPALVALPPVPGVSYEPLHNASFDLPRIQMAGFGFDPQNRPLAGWSESSGNGGVNNFRWSRRENGTWVVTTMTQPGGGIRAQQPDFVLRQDGTPFFAYSIRDAWIFGQDWYTAHIVDLSAYPTGHGPIWQVIESGTSCISSYVKFAMAFEPGASSPGLLIGTHCSYGGWLSLNGAAVHGEPAFRTPAGIGGEFHSIDYAVGPDGSNHVTYYSERGGPNWGAYYSNGSPGHEVFLEKPHRNRTAETSIAVGPDGRIHVAIGGVPLCGNTFEGGLLYLTSIDGVNWTRTFVDELSGHNPSLVLNEQGEPRIAYWRYNTEVRFASLDGAAWSSTPVYSAVTPVGLTSVKLAYDNAGQPHVLFFNPDTSNITVASGIPSNLAPALTNPGTQTSAAGESESLPLAAVDPESGALSFTACGLPPGLTIDPNTGLVTGTITPGTTGTYRVTVTVTDNAGNTSTVTFNWEIKENRTPQITDPGAQSDPEGDTISLPLIAGDPDGDSLSFSAVNLPPGLTIAAGTGVISGTLTFDAAGSYTVTITVSDGSLSASKSFNWIVTNVNRDPTADSGSVTTAEDTGVQITLSASDADADPLTYAIVGNPAQGSVTLANGVVTYNPNQNFNGPDSFTFKTNDGAADSNIATISLSVTPVNDAPNAMDNTATTAEDSAVLINVLANDVDVEGDTLSISGAANGSHGLVTVNAGGTITYTPAANFNGADTFTYNLSDGEGGLATASVNVTVSAVNDAPIAANDSAATAEDTAVNIIVLTNDTDVDGDMLTLSAVTQGAHGVVSLNPDGSVTYTPSLNYFGADSFTYNTSDGQGGVATASVNVTVNAVNDAPSAANDSASTAEDTAVNISVLANDADVDGDTLSVLSTTNGSHGVVTVNGDGTIKYTPADNYNGADSFTYNTSDGQGGVATASVNVTVNAVNDAPSAANDSAFTAEDTAVNISVLSNDTDVDGDTVTLNAVTQPAHGTLSINPFGSVTYTPNLNFFGADAFSYNVGDGQGGTSTATVSLSVTPVNDAPTALDGTAVVNEDGQIVITLVGADIDSGGLGFTILNESLNGTLSTIVGNKVTYTPNPNFNGTDLFTFKTNDGEVDSNPACVAIDVVPVADAPVLATVGNMTVAEGVLLSFTLSAFDPDGEILTYGANGLPAGATLDPLTGAFNWTPTYEQAGSYAVNFTVADPGDLSDVETSTITVTDVVTNSGPVCSSAYPSIAEIWPPNHHRTELINIFGISDPDGDPLSVGVTRILQDEPTNTLGDGTTWVDGGGLGTPAAWVRAERSGTPRIPGNGRVYEIFFEASDGRGKTCTGSVKVGVPHDQGKGPARDDGKRYDSTVSGGPCLNCSN